MILVDKAVVCLIKAALDVVAQTVANKALGLVRDDGTLAVLLDHQDVSRSRIREAGIVEGAYLRCIKVLITPLLLWIFPLLPLLLWMQKFLQLPAA